jgi:dienelactone hydrolase
VSLAHLKCRHAGEGGTSPAGTKYDSSVVSAAKRTRHTRLRFGSQVAAGLLAVLAVLVLAACGGSPAQRTTSAPTKRPTGPSGSVAASPARGTTSAGAAPLGNPGSYQVGTQQLTFTEAAHTGPAGQSLGPRTLVTQVDYPLAPSSGSQPAAGPLPLIVFGPGYLQCVDAYAEMLGTWASAGYVVAAVTFPVTNCELGNAANESDLVNQPADMSAVISGMLSQSKQHGLFGGLLSAQEIGVAGQSDGGDTVAALAANTCCMDHRLKAAAVLSGAEWPAMGGQYFPAGTPPMLFTQGNADTVNPPSASVLLYRADQAGTRYYLNLLGASHLAPYEGTNPLERLTARVTLAFFNRYVLGQPGALATMMRDGNAPGVGALVSGGHVPLDAG